MKKWWIRYLLIGLLVIVVMTQVSTASGRPLLSTATYPYYVGSSSAKASSSANIVIENQNQMKCLYDSWTYPYTTINVIGFTWVACTAKCRRSDGTEYRVDWEAWNPGYITDSENFKLDFVNKGCAANETEIWVAEAWHDFNDTNLT